MRWSDDDNQSRKVRLWRRQSCQVRAPPKDVSTTVLRFRLSTSAPAGHIKTQLHPCVGGAYGSSALLTGPQTEGICARMNDCQRDRKKTRKRRSGRLSGLRKDDQSTRSMIVWWEGSRPPHDGPLLPSDQVDLRGDQLSSCSNESNW